jgi:MATE family multidrug resistance protein
VGAGAVVTGGVRVVDSTAAVTRGPVRRPVWQADYEERLVRGISRSTLRRRWHGRGGYDELLALAFPLILSTGSWSLQHFVDRMFLAWYSPESIAASTPAGILNYTLMSPFIGTAAYVSTFVAQYHGAERPERIGPAVWQGVYVSAGGAVVMALLVPLAEPMFRLVGHPLAIRQQEAVYFRILCLGAFPGIACAALSGFFSGRGQTWPVMWVNFLGTGVNIVFDYLLVFGARPFPEMGIAGAAWATNASMVASLLAYVLLMGRGAHGRRYRILHAWRLDPLLFSRILRFGLPSGIQFFIDMAGFTVFLLIVGRLGTVSLAATNVALNINTLAFMPMIGLGMAVTILVGQHLGRDDPARAERAVFSGLHITLAYMGGIALLYVATPGLFLAPYALHSDPQAFGPIRQLSVVLLRFVALYSIFDVFNIVFAAALKGAGDTRFVMYMIAALSTGLLTVPTYVAIEVLGAGVLTAWTVGTIYVSVLGIAFYLRFRSGVWKSMRVIEPQPQAAD